MKIQFFLFIVVKVAIFEPILEALTGKKQKFFLLKKDQTYLQVYVGLFSAFLNLHLDPKFLDFLIFYFSGI